jgi:hypothetical protein
MSINDGFALEIQRRHRSASTLRTSGLKSIGDDSNLSLKSCCFRLAAAWAAGQWSIASLIPATVGSASWRMSTQSTVASAWPSLNRGRRNLPVPAVAETDEQRDDGVEYDPLG